MKIQATKTIEIELTIQPTAINLIRNGWNYPYTIISPDGETVGWLRELYHGVYRTQMIDNNYIPSVTKFSEKDFRLEETQLRLQNKEKTNG